MQGKEKVLAVMIGIMVLVIIALSLRLQGTKLKIGETEAQLNRIHASRIASYDSQILVFERIVSTLHTKIDSLENEKSKIRTVTIHEIDSIRALPFGSKAVFFTEQSSRLDSVRSRYVGLY